MAVFEKRIRVEDLDDKLVDILSKRMNIVDEIGTLKKEHNVSVLQNERWQAIINRMKSEENQKGLTEDFILQLFKLVHQESISHQNKIINKK